MQSGEELRQRTWSKKQNEDELASRKKGGLAHLGEVVTQCLTVGDIPKGAAVDAVPVGRRVALINEDNIMQDFNGQGQKGEVHHMSGPR